MNPAAMHHAGDLVSAPIASSGSTVAAIGPKAAAPPFRLLDRCSAHPAGWPAGLGPAGSQTRAFAPARLSRLASGRAGWLTVLAFGALCGLSGCDPTHLSNSTALDSDAESVGGSCHPLFQDCPPAHLCLREATGFECVSNWVDETGDDSSWESASVGDPCDALDPCGAGLDCIVEPILESCAGQFGCCTAYCDLSGSDPCVTWGLTCQPYFLGDVPAGYDDLGMCLR